MKTPFILFIITLSASYAIACNQKVLDKAYYDIVKTSLTTKITCKKTMVKYERPNCQYPKTDKRCYFEAPGCETNELEILKERNDALIFLKDLCNGQKSHWEVLSQK